jgi:cyanobactin maturation PatA/PatG family protease
LVNGSAPNGPALAHGTHVASIIFGQQGSSVLGVAPNCSGLIVPIFSDEPQGIGQLDLARAILTAIENGAHIINISGGQLTSSGEPEPILAQAIERCAEHNALIVAAAGNNGCECLHLPAAAPSVLAVGAMDHDGTPLSSSNWGESYRSQGILAPGVDVLGAVPGGGTARKSGTSFAAPFVSGLVGLFASLQIKQGRTPDPHAIAAALLKSATPCLPPASDDCRRFLAGRLNIQAAVEELFITRGEDHMIDTAKLSASEGSAPFPEKTVVQTAGGIAPTAGARGAIEDRAMGMSEDASRMPQVSESATAPEIAAKPQLPPAPAARAPRQVTPSDCGCGGGANCTCGGGQKPALVYALGQLGYDFGTDAHRDGFTQNMPSSRPPNEPSDADPYNPNQLVTYLTTATTGFPPIKHDFEAASVIWTLNLDATPIYAIQPAGAYAIKAYELLVDFLQMQYAQEKRVEIVSVPGTIVGSVRLRSGQIIPVISPRILGMYAWAPDVLAESVLGLRPTSAEAVAPRSLEDAQRLFDAQRTGVLNFLHRVYYDLRNLGVTGEDRALNFAATNMVSFRAVIETITEKGYELDKISVEKSPVCRPDGSSECYDIKLWFFKPSNMLEADQIFKLTIDVGDTMPVSIGVTQQWSQRA